MVTSDKLAIHIIANAALGPVLSGSDRIFIECARRWARKGNDIFIYVWEEGYEMCKRNELKNVNYIIWSALRWKKLGFPISYLARAIIGSVRILKLNISHDRTHRIIVYSASDFWPDSIPAFVMKLRSTRAKWIAGFYLFAPKPWQKDSPYRGKRFLLGLFYSLTQFLAYWIIKRYSDMVFVTSQPDVKRFVTRKRDKTKILVIRGGIDLKPSIEYLNSKKESPIEKRRYDACFVGRFHYQKGVRDLINIWRLVVKRKSDAKLAMVGTGPLISEVQDKIAQFGLNDNIELLGFKDGEEKYEVFRQSRVIVHPATYDSGGMAAIEGMAWRLPGVSFDLEALKTYYPKGMLKTPCYDLNAFAENIIKLLENKKLYKKTREDAIVWAKEWDWDKRAATILKRIEKLCFQQAILESRRENKR